MSPILRAIYFLLRVLVKTMFRIFYEKTVVLHEERFRFKNACITVSNHPSTLTDPLHVAKETKKNSFFLANASLFKSKFGDWFFNTFYCIPVERPQDVGGRKIQNEDAFKRADEHLSKNGCLYIAPQGGSKMVRRLGYSIKTGTARIALSAESKNDFKLGLTILPVGLNYTNPTLFRSSVLINAGEHIKVTDYKTLYQEHPKQAVIKLTKDLEDRMRSLVLDTDDDDDEYMVECMEHILNSKTPLPLGQNFYRNKTLIANLYKLKAVQSDQYQKLADATQNHFRQLTQLGTTAPAVFGKTNLGFPFLGLLIGLPIFIYGWLNNLFANFIPALAAKKLKLYIGYTATVKIVLGLFTYPILYGLQVWLVHRFFENIWITLAYFISLPLSGLFAWTYRKRYLQLQATAKWKKLNKEKPTETNSLLVAQTALADELNQLIQEPG